MSTLRYKNLKKIQITLTLIVSLLFASNAFAEVIQKIEISGNGRVEESTIKNYLGLFVGDQYAPQKASKALRDLYKTNLFDNVEIGWNAGVLEVQVKENPIVNRVVFENNEDLEDKRLEAVVALRSRAVFTPGKAQQDVKAILAAYRQTGRFLAQVTPEIIRRDQNRVDVIYKVSEGRKSKVRKIEFLGNKHFSDNDLRSEIATRQASFWRFWGSADSYDPDKLEFDKELLRRFYVDSGYADFRVVSAVAELIESREDFFITFTLEEGKPYTFGAVEARVSGQFPIEIAELEAVLRIKEGDRYNASRIDDDIDALIELLGQKGFAFLDVVPIFNKNPNTQKIDVAFDVRPGPRVYINRINISGNTRTQDHVIRREMRLVEGDAFSSTKLKRSQDRVQVLDFFETVNIEREETESPDRVDLNVKVEEKSTGEFNIGAGFSTFEGVIGTTDVRERNFLGRGQNLVLSFAVSEERRDVNFSVTEPWFLGREISAGIDIFNEEREFQEQSSFDRRNTGAAFRLGFALNEYVRNTVRLGYRETDISGVGLGASQFVQDEIGTRDSLSITNALIFDNRDNSLLPTRGSRLEWAVSYSGFGSDIEYIRNQFLASRHFALDEEADFVLSGALRGGHLLDIGSNTPIFENFHLGGFDLRGFDRAGIGPRDSVTNDALGGRLMFGHTVELRFPIPGADESGLKGVLFSDGGIVTDFQQESSPLVRNTEKYRVSAGVGLFWNSPLGPLRFEFGFPLIEAEEDEQQVFSFNFGTRF